MLQHATDTASPWAMGVDSTEGAGSDYANYSTAEGKGDEKVTCGAHGTRTRGSVPERGGCGGGKVWAPLAE